MKLEVSDVIEYQSKDYLVLDVITHNESRYALMNDLEETNDEEVYKVLNITNELASEVNDTNLLNELLEIFSKNIQKLVDKYNEGGDL